MQAKLETAAGKSEGVFTARTTRPRSWIPLIVAVFLLPFANGGTVIALAAWLTPLFLMRFTRTHRITVAVPLILAVQVVALAVQYRGMVPFPTPIYLAVILFYGLCFTLPTLLHTTLFG